MWDLWMEKQNQPQKHPESDEEDYSQDMDDEDPHETDPEKAKEAGEEMPLKDEW